MKGQPPSVRARFRTAVAAGGKLFVSSIVAFELSYGVSKSSQPEANRQRLRAFMAAPVTLLTFDDRDAESAGAVRAALEVLGKPIGAYDVLIAGQALARKFTLVTVKVSEFARVTGLAWQDWSKAS